MEKKIMLSKGFFLCSFLGVVIFGTILWIEGIVAIVHSEGEAVFLGYLGLLFITLAALLGLFGAVVMYVMVYRMWKAIQDGYARTTPGKAVGFMFIPFFNFYWFFQVFWGFSKDYNAFIKRHSIATNRLSEWLFLAYSIIIVVSALPFIPLYIPYTWMLMAIASFIIFIILVVKICDAVNALQRATPAEPAQNTEAGREQV